MFLRLYQGNDSVFESHLNRNKTKVTDQTRKEPNGAHAVISSNSTGTICQHCFPASKLLRFLIELKISLQS